MRTVTYRSVYEGLVRLTGGDAATVSADTAAKLMEFLNVALSDCHEYWRWPELMRTEGRYYRPTWTATSYASLAEVYYAPGDAYYRANAACILTDVPGTSSKWDAVTEFARYVSFTQTGQTAIEAVLEAWDQDPRVYHDAVRLGFAIDADGVRFAADEDLPTRVWLEFRLRAPEYLYSVLWTAMTSLITGDNSTFASDTGYWTKYGAATIAGGKLNLPDGAFAATPALLVEGKPYRFTVTVDSLTAGAVQYFSGTGYVNFATVAGTYTVEFTALGPSGFTFKCAGGAGVLDTVLVSNAFAAGVTVYHAGATETGELYLANAICSGADVPGTSTKWTKLDVPYIFRPAAILKAYALWLVQDAQAEKAKGFDHNDPAAPGQFQNALDEQVMQFTKLQGQTGRPYAVPLR